MATEEGSMYRIGEAARQLGLNPQTLYFYERRGLIPPPPRTRAGHRLFDEATMERLAFITRAKALGLSLSEIQQLLAQPNGEAIACRDGYRQLSAKVQQLERQIAQLQALKSELQQRMACCQHNRQGEEVETPCLAFDRPSTSSRDCSSH